MSKQSGLGDALYLHGYDRSGDIGSLEKGKLADFIVVDRDILTCPVDEIRDILVESTYLGGKLVYSRRSGGPSNTALK